MSYFGSRLWEIDPQPLPSWKTLPDLRRFISEQLIQLAVTISCCSDSIKELLPSSIYLKISYPNIYSSKTVLYQVLGMQINICQECIPLSDLQVSYNYFSFRILALESLAARVSLFALIKYQLNSLSVQKN